MTTKPEGIPQDVWDAAGGCFPRNNWNPLAIERVARAILAAKAEEHARVVELEAVLVRIALRDRHYRIVKPKEDGGFRGPGSMIATFALTGVNGSFIGDKAILDQHPEAEKSLMESHPELIAAIRKRGEG